MLKVVRQFLRRKPFHPFRVVMRSGARHHVVNPDRVAIGKSQMFLYSYPSNRMTWLSEADIELVYEPRRARG